MKKWSYQRHELPAVDLGDDETFDVCDGTMQYGSQLAKMNFKSMILAAIL
jgi:hypothetical protein